MSDRLLKESDVMRAIDKRVEELSNDPVFVRKRGYIDVLGIKKHILTIPSTDRPQGEWIDVNGDGSLWRCDQCKDTACCKGNFCPTCGARMKGADNE